MTNTGKSAKDFHTQHGSPSMKPSISEAEFEVMAKQTGIPLSAAQKAELYGAYWMLEAMIARVQTPMPREAEPAHIFVPEVR
jgi:hypothetical protein